ncbi:hypothetical protein [Streptomyces sp. NBC_00557]|uniref:hypothetical protein n=1 Tax=Streptomyces sp. NBC_00557 TaxID=2975776 RepID=UPI002E81B008|nr:hypothetical protein [Streptomyces sp. NBC_00557]WUC33747.1 hypothetical protein OG956_05760 [Streptomyces sp. NBC_00557]
MVLLLPTDGGDVMQVLAVRDGARARDELARFTVEINPVSGGVEVVDQSEVSENVVPLGDRAVPLFARYGHRALTDLSVVPSLLPTLDKVTTGRAAGQTARPQSSRTHP